MADPGERIEDVLPARVSNARIAEVLFNIATILEMQQANPYRIAAYRNAARGILAQGEPVAPIFARGELPPVPGLGERLRKKISELVLTGHMTFYDDLCEESLPEDVRDLMRVPHVGPRTALRLAGQLDIHSVPQLWEAADRRSLREHYGFGPRSEARIARGARSVLDLESSAA
jgi:DNA polymerase (family 10)